MKKSFYALILAALSVSSAYSQNVGIGTSTPSASAKLDVSSTTSGVLIPRIALSMTTVAAPVAAPANSLLVYNTATAGDVTPGFYYWSSVASAWIRIAEGRAGWEITGNNGITAANFLGTINAADLIMRTTNVERMRITPAGNVGIGTTTPAATTEIYANSTVPTPHLLLRENGNDYARLSYMNTNTAAKYWTNSAILDAAVDHNSVWNVYYSNGVNILSVTGDNRVGINVLQNPNLTFDVNGDVAYREGTAIALVNGVNSNLAVGSTSYLRITGPTAAFSITGLGTGVNGKIITLINTTTFPMTLSHDVTSVAANRIYTPGGTPLVIDVQYGTVTLQYNSTYARWVVVSYSKKDGTDWLLVGNAGTNDPAAPVTYGTSLIAANENWLGTIDANDIVLGTNNLERFRIKQTTGNVGVGTANPLQPFHAYKNSDATKATIFGESRQINTGADYNNFGVAGYGRGGNGTWGYGIGVVGIGDMTNSWHAQGVHALLGTTLPAAIPNTDAALYADGATLGYSGIFMNGNAGFETLFPNERVELGGTDAKLFMNSATSNMLYFNTAGVAAPAFTTRSNGTKIILYPQVSATAVDYAIGITGSTQWYSIPEATSTYSYRWYSGVTEGMRFRGDGRLGIGIAAPTATRLQAYDPVAITSRIAIFRNAAADGTEVQTGSIEYLHDYASTTDFNDGFNTVGLTINFNASSGYDLQLANNAAAKPTSNAWTIVSDARLKEDVHPFKDGLATLRQINPIYYKYNGKANTPANEYGIGILAQDMKEIAPYTVGIWEYLPDESNKSNIEEYLSYNSHALDYVAINAIKELDQKQHKMEVVYKNISDFGMATLNTEETFIPFSEDFRANLDATIQPIVTLTPIGNNNVSLSIVEQTIDGFKVKIVGHNNSVQVNWIAMAKVNANALNTTIEYSDAERQKMLDKVKLPTTRLRERIAREEMELKKFHTELKEAEAKEANSSNNMPEYTEPAHLKNELDRKNNAAKK